MKKWWEFWKRECEHKNTWVYRCDQRYQIVEITKCSKCGKELDVVIRNRN